jgi:hypothetical protein
MYSFSLFSLTFFSPSSPRIPTHKIVFIDIIIAYNVQNTTNIQSIFTISAQKKEKKKTPKP